MTITGSHVAWPPLSNDGEDGEHQPPKYRDFSGLRPEDVPPSPQPSLRAAKRRKGPKELSFPTKLHDLLTKCSTGDFAQIISWQEHGRSFVILDTKQFATRIMPSYFKQSKFHSFQRQLNLYGFKKLGTGPDKGGYYHELFLREKRFLAKKMKRTKVKGVGRQPFLPDSEPNFLELPFMPKLGASGSVTETETESSPARFNTRIQSEATAVVSTTSSDGGASVSTTRFNTRIQSEATAVVSTTSSYGGTSVSSVTSSGSSSGGYRTLEPPTSTLSRHQLRMECMSALPSRTLASVPTLPMQQLHCRSASDEVARSAQRILAEVKGTVSPEVRGALATGLSAAPAQVLQSSMLLPSSCFPPPNEADMIMGALDAVALYYNIGTSAV